MDEKAPSEADFDTILEVIRHEGPDTACVFNCQVSILIHIFELIRVITQYVNVIHNNNFAGSNFDFIIIWKIISGGSGPIWEA